MPIDLCERLIREAYKLRREGKTQQEISGILGVGKRQIQNYHSEVWLRERGLEHLKLPPPSLAVSVPIVASWKGRDWEGKERIARFVTVEVSAESKLTGVEGWIEVISPRGPSTPLHWRGLPISPHISSAQDIPIHPIKPARLDVAFTSPTARDGLKPPPLTSGQIPSMIQGNEARHNGEGCWLAQPEALFNPDCGLEAYLKPGKYRVKVRAGCSEGAEASLEFILVSPSSWEDLDWRPAP